MDFYALLGVARTASAADVERAYRRLARRYHPGVNPGDRVAEQMYRRVQEAYFVLSDSERRRKYDRGLLPVDEQEPVAFEGFDFSTPAEGPFAATFSELFADVFVQAAREATTPTRGQDVTVTMHVPFEDAVRGAERPVSVTRQERCSACRGRGYTARAVASCPSCSGQGTLRWTRGHMVFRKRCPTCGGDGRTLREACRRCSATGVVPRAEVVTVTVPPGIESGSRIAVPGRGHAGALGGPYGDLYVTIEVGDHRIFRREGADLHLTLPVSIAEAAFGADVTIPGLDGPVTIRVPAGTASGTTLRVPGAGGVRHGTTARGDLVATVQLVLPRSLDERSRELLREFARINREDVRRHLFETH
ncbi:MAG: J domain-containing protein [Acidobacteriota bacterium]|nr:MAG: molecular chaperone DnaJ [Acidobacteriota bacterium]